MHTSRDEAPADRLADVHRYRALDLANDARLGRFVQLVAHVAAAPAAGISLVDEDRTWLAARVGLQESSFPRELSFCSRTIGQRGAYVVTDAAHDLRLRGTPLARAKMRFYAGVPIRSQHGHAVGALFAMDEAPRVLTPQQIELLEMLARQVESDLHARLRVHPIEAGIDAGLRAEESFRERPAPPVGEIGLYRFAVAHGACVLADAEGLASFAGVEAQQLAGPDDVLQLAHPADRAVISATIENPASALHPVLVRWRDRAGTYGWMALRNALAHDDRGTLLGFEARAARLGAMSEGIESLAATRAHLVASLLGNQRRRDELLALLVHDFKSPLSAVLAATYALSLSPRLDESDRALLDEIEASARSLDRQVLGILDIHRSENGQLQPTRARTDLVRVAEEAVRTVQVYARLHGKRIEIAAPGPVEADVDADLLRRAIENLLDNASRHARETIVVEVRDGPEIVVRDDGPGFSAEQAEAIFEKFVRYDGARRGRGLGLAFCRMAAQANGGTITAEPNQPTGASFRLRLG